ncbi:MAG: histidine kinase [Rhizobacter sp.]|nr:histidine kinase [Rhizobacter sp.]
MWRLTGPLLAVVVVASVGAYAIALRSSQLVLDRSLFDSATSLARQARVVRAQTQMDLPQTALDVFEWDQVDQIYFEISSVQQGTIVSNASLRLASGAPALPALPQQPLYFDTAVLGVPVRALALTTVLPQGDHLLVKVAETRNKRNQVARDVLVSALTLSLLVVIGAAGAIWFGVGSGLRALDTAVRRIVEGHVHKEAIGNHGAAEPVPDEVRPLAEEIDHLLGELSAAQASQERFVGNAAHQMRTPLAALGLQIDLARRETDDRRRAEALADAASGITRISHLLHQLLTLARIDEGEADSVDSQPIDLDLLAREEVERCVDAALARGVDLGYVAPVGRVEVSGKGGLIREALANLIDNALKYASAGGMVTVGVANDPPALYVEDAGPGIPPSEHDHVKDRFYRIAGTQADGCGLGLSIVDEIARRHGAVFTLGSGGGGVGLRAAIEFG